MKLDEELRQAIAHRDIRTLSRLVDILRLRWGLPYHALLELASEALGRTISAAEWDALMEDCDDADVDP